MDLRLEGKVAIVTGGARGVGAAITMGFVREGARVVIADILFDTAQELAESIEGNERKAVAVKTDVRKKSDADNLVYTTVKEFGKIDILVNNAGVCRINKFTEIEEEEWDLVNSVNVKGVYLVTRAAIPHMIAAKQGKIVNVASISGKVGFEGEGAYAPSKFAVMGLTQVLALELAKYNINVNAVCPGIVCTPMWEELLVTMSQREGVPRDRIFDKWCELIPLRRPQTPEDIANVVLFLGSEVSRNLTGEAISINGGMRMD